MFINKTVLSKCPRVEEKLPSNMTSSPTLKTDYVLPPPSLMTPDASYLVMRDSFTQVNITVTFVIFSTCWIREDIPCQHHLGIHHERHLHDHFLAHDRNIWHFAHIG